MADHVTDALKIRLEDLERKLKARSKGGSAYADNVAEIDEAIAQIKAEIANREA